MCPPRLRFGSGGGPAKGWFDAAVVLAPAFVPPKAGAGRVRAPRPPRGGGSSRPSPRLATPRPAPHRAGAGAARARFNSWKRAEAPAINQCPPLCHPPSSASFSSPRRRSAPRSPSAPPKWKHAARPRPPAVPPTEHNRRRLCQPARAAPARPRRPPPSPPTSPLGGGCEALPAAAGGVEAPPTCSAQAPRSQYDYFFHPGGV